MGKRKVGYQMSWEQQAVKACNDKGLEVVPYGFDGGYVFVKDSDGKIVPIIESVVAKWINKGEGE